MVTTKELKLLWTKADIKRREFEYDEAIAHSLSKTVLGGGTILLLIIYFLTI